MKKFLLFTVMAVVSVLTLQSCSKDDDDSSDVYTAVFSADATISGNLAKYYNAILTYSVKNAKTNDTWDVNLSSMNFESAKYATPCTFTYTITFEKVADFDTTQSYSLDCDIKLKGSSVKGNSVSGAAYSEDNTSFSGMKGTNVEKSMAAHKVTGTITVNSDGTVSKSE